MSGPLGCMLLLSRFSRVQLCATPWTAAHQAPCPWDSPGKNTGVGCHFFLQCMKVKSESEVAQSCPDSQRPHGLQPTRLLRPWHFPDKSTGVGYHCLLHNFIEYWQMYSKIIDQFIFLPLVLEVSFPTPMSTNLGIPHFSNSCLPN